MTRRVLGLIPARGGSKGILNKNIVDLGGKPLIAWTIEAALKSKYVTDTVVSSDHEKILDVARKAGAQILKRPLELAADDTPSEAVALHALEKLPERYDYLMLLQPTSPFRDAETIDTACENFFASDATALISLLRVDNKILKAFKSNEKGFIEGIAGNRYPFMPRQSLPDTYMSNGAIYLIRTDLFLRNRSFWSDRTLPFVMGEYESLDIDTPEDLKYARELLECVN